MTKINVTTSRAIQPTVSSEARDGIASLLSDLMSGNLKPIEAYRIPSESQRKLGSLLAGISERVKG